MWLLHAWHDHERAALLQIQPNPTGQEIKQALAGNRVVALAISTLSGDSGGGAIT
jgi:hypothetical protein